MNKSQSVYQKDSASNIPSIHCMVFLTVRTVTHLC